MYYIQGIGYYPIDVKHLPKDLYKMNKIELLDLLIFKFNDKTWIQKNYISGRIRIIIKLPISKIKTRWKRNVVNLSLRILKRCLQMQTPSYKSKTKSR